MTDFSHSDANRSATDLDRMRRELRDATTADARQTWRLVGLGMATAAIGLLIVWALPIA